MESNQEGWLGFVKTPIHLDIPQIITIILTRIQYCRQGRRYDDGGEAVANVRLISVTHLLLIMLLMATVIAVAQETPQPLSDEEFEMIVFHSGNPDEWLRIVVMTDEQAKWLVEPSGLMLQEAWLNGLTSISEKHAKILSGFKGNVLQLNGLDSLTDKQMKALCKLKPMSTRIEEFHKIVKKNLVWSSAEVSLNGLTTVTDKQAEYLSQVDVTDLSLNSLASLSDRQVEALKNAKAKRIYLDGLPTLTDNQLKTLAESDCKFGLRGLGRESRSEFKSYGGKLVKRSERP